MSLCCSDTSSPVPAKVSAASFSVWRLAAHPLHHVWAAPVHQRHCICLSVIGTSLWEELRLVLHGGAGWRGGGGGKKVDITFLIAVDWSKGGQLLISKGI